MRVRISVVLDVEDADSDQEAIAVVRELLESDDTPFIVNDYNYQLTVVD